MKRISVFAVLSAAFLLNGVVLRADAPAAPDGAKIYAAKCAACHAKDGKGNPAMAKLFKLEPSAVNLTKKETQDKKDTELVAITTDGKEKMPAQKGKLQPAEIASAI